MNGNTKCRIRRALISVSDKTGISEFAKELASLGVEIVSTGGTHKTLTEAGIPALYVSEITGFPEILDGRVKTLHPAIHGGILARRSEPEHLKALDEQGIVPIDLVAVNLYPFREVAKRGGTWEELIENIDIGGPSMVRAAAKNHEDVIILVNPEDYSDVLEQLKQSGDCPRDERKRLAIKAFRHTAEYDACIHAALSGGSLFISAPPAPAVEKICDLRYGENPGQPAVLFRELNERTALLRACSSPLASLMTFIDAEQLQGKELSYNNWLDADSAFKISQEYGMDEPSAVIVKHTNPCGVALGVTIEEAFAKAYDSDPVSAFGGIIVLNRPVTQALATTLAASFWEVILAPVFSEDALHILKAKPNLRLLALTGAAWVALPEREWKSIQGGFLVQERDLQLSPPESWTQVTKLRPSEAEFCDLAFAWKAVKHVKSNAIVLAKDRVMVGVGAGQMNRVGSAEIALKQAGEKARGAILASDAFLPFPDVVRMAAEYGIRAIVQTGGSLKDKDSTAAADELGIAMLHTGVRHFKH